MAYRVTAPYVTVDVQGPAGSAPTTLGFYAGGLLPANVVPESARRLVAKGMVEELDGVPAEPEAETGPVPPRKNASKADWVAYAVSQRGEDVSEADAAAAAEAMTHAELVARFGG